ncbi:MAG: hypothetical protein IPN47_18475 [Gemmatimonadetes bacterium]|nr:hypothetical protein [Gemmatimonadota bacterium]
MRIVSRWKSRYDGRCGEWWVAAPGLEEISGVLLRCRYSPTRGRFPCGTRWWRHALVAARARRLRKEGKEGS